MINRDLKDINRIEPCDSEDVTGHFYDCDAAVCREVMNVT